MIGIAVIGAGRIGRIHAANAAANARLSLKYVVDPYGDATGLAQEHGAQTTDVEQAWADPEVAGVVIASSTDTHLDYTLAAVRAGKHVFCEKPLDQDVDRALGALKELEAAGPKILLGFNRRFDPNFASLRAQLSQGAVGALETLHIISHDPAPPPPAYIKTSGGIFKDMSIHDFDMARWLLDEEIESVFASASVLVDPEIGAAGDFDSAKIILRTATGKLCVISNSRRSGYGYDQRIEAFGSKGLIRADNVLETTVQSWTEPGAKKAPFENFFLDRYADAYRIEMAHFADVVEGKAAPLADQHDGVGALLLAQAAEQSARTGSVVTLGTGGDQ
ncbi:inositol 2-dehydrogenase [Sphingobium mellinum]|uniref:inositol 2-dehydrogenase n=1 Tax=Sphingobium mellinum TaxID=1387166 RepID=UPI0030EDFDF0